MPNTSEAPETTDATETPEAAATDIAVSDRNTALADPQARLNALASRIKKNIKLSGTSIALTVNGTLRFPSGDEVDTFQAVVLDYRYRNIYYPERYNPNDPKPAACFAVGYEQNELLVPSELAPDIQSASCSTCKQNEWKSSRTGTGKACSNQLLLAVMLPDLDHSEEIMIIKASPTSLRKASTYLLRATELYGHPINCVTEFKVDIERGWPTLVCTAVGKNLDPEKYVSYLETAGKVLEASPIPATASGQEVPHTPKGSGRAPRK